MVSLHKSIHFMSQTVAFSLFSTPIPAITNFSWFGFNSEYFENVSNVLRSSLIDILVYENEIFSLPAEFHFQFQSFVF